MAVHLNHTPDIAVLHTQLSNTLDQIDCALDRRDRRAFKLWASRRASLTARLGNLLVKIATGKE